LIKTDNQNLGLRCANINAEIQERCKKQGKITPLKINNSTEKERTMKKGKA
jgi:hypothetical protein